MGIPPLLRDFQGRVEAGENLLLVFAGFHAPAFSTALAVARLRPRLTQLIESAHHVGAVADRDLPIQVFMDGYRASCQRAPKSCFADLSAAISDGYGIVLGHRPLSLHREDPLQIRPATATKSGSLLCRGNREFLVELTDVPLP